MCFVTYASLGNIGLDVLVDDGYMRTVLRIVY